MILTKAKKHIHKTSFDPILSSIINLFLFACLIGSQHSKYKKILIKIYFEKKNLNTKSRIHYAPPCTSCPVHYARHHEQGKQIPYHLQGDLASNP